EPAGELAAARAVGGVAPAPGGCIEYRLSAIGIDAAQLGKLQDVDLPALTLQESRQQQQTATGPQASDLTVEDERPVLAFAVEAVHSQSLQRETRGLCTHAQCKNWASLRAVVAPPRPGLVAMATHALDTSVPGCS